MNEIVLVHGAWHGAWCWERLVPLLGNAGHCATTPTLTGSGDRAGELSQDVTLARHVDDIVATLDKADMHEVILVGHSYSGMVITAVADPCPYRFSRAGVRLLPLTLTDAGSNESTPATT